MTTIFKNSNIDETHATCKTCRHRIGTFCEKILDYVTLKDWCSAYKKQKIGDKMNILSLDLATKTGWATFFDHRIFSGVQTFDVKRGESPGMRFLRFRSWLHEMKQNCPGEIDIIVFEQAHHRGGAATQLCVGMMTDVLAFAAEINAETMPVHTATLKKFATGKGNASKQEMIDAAILYGYGPKDDNEADACLLLEYARQQLRG